MNVEKRFTSKQLELLVSQTSKLEQIQKIFHLLDEPQRIFLLENAGCNTHVNVVRYILSQSKIVSNDIPYNAITKWKSVDLIRLVFENMGDEANIDYLTEYAMKKGRMDVIKHFVEKFGVDWGPLSISPLWSACFYGQMEIVKYLIEQKNANINQSDRSQFSPLGIAVSRNQLRIAEYLLNKKCDINNPDHFHRNPMSIACRNGNLRMLKLLVKHGMVLDQPDNLGETPFSNAIKHGYLEIMKYLVETVKVDVNKPNRNNQSPLYVAACCGRFGVVKYLCDQKGIQFKPHDARSFQYSIQRNFPEITKLLVEKKLVDVAILSKER